MDESVSSSESSIEFVDRYGAVGAPRPDPSTVCLGQCEGMGTVPVHAEDEDPTWSELYREAHAAAGVHDCDGWHFVKCPACNGTGVRSAAA